MSKADRNINDVLGQHLGRIEPRVGGYRPKPYFRSEQSAGCAPFFVLTLVLALIPALSIMLLLARVVAALGKIGG